MWLFLPLGIGSDKSEKFAIAHGVSVQLKRRDLYWCITCADGGGWDGDRCAATEGALGLQPGDLRKWLRERSLPALRHLLLLALRLLETLSFLLPTLRLGPLPRLSLCTLSLLPCLLRQPVLLLQALLRCQLLKLLEFQARR
jgi:hypothetical protein